MWIMIVVMTASVYQGNSIAISTTEFSSDTKCLAAADTVWKSKVGKNIWYIQCVEK